MEFLLLSQMKLLRLLTVFDFHYILVRIGTVIHIVILMPFSVPAIDDYYFSIVSCIIYMIGKSD